MILSATSAQHVESDKEANPFADNVEFLEAKSRVVMLLLERASLIRKSSLSGGTDGDSTGGNAAPGRVRQRALFNASEPDLRGFASALDDVCRRLAELREQNRSRLEVSAPDDVPFLSLAGQFKLDGASQDVIWLLFFKATCTDFRQRFRDFKRANFDGMNPDDMYVGDVLSVLFPGDFGRQLTARKLFSTDSPLLGRHLVEAPYRINGNFSVLEQELQLPSRIIRWISGDNNQYSVEVPFIAERPDTQLSHVILPDAVIDPVLKLVEGHDEYVRLRKTIGIDAVVQYGRAVVILEYGPSGTGKTLLARAISNHTGKPLISLPPDNSDDRFPPRRPGNRDREHLSMLFREGQLQNGIVFIDECEDLCRKDSALLKELLIELERSEALVIMATNQPKALAPAIDRRITLKVPFEVPSRTLRKRIWELLLPKDVPLADDVDLESLARTYPFSGGYIKNAVLTALNLALSRSLDQNVLVTHADLEEAARLQERHVGPLLTLRKLKTPRLGLSDCVVSERELTRLESITRMARNYSAVMSRWGWHGRVIQARSRGLKVLFCGECYECAVEAAEAVAGERAVRIDQVQLHRIISMNDVQRLRSREKEAERFQIADVFSKSADSGHLMLLSDERGIMGRAAANADTDTLHEFFDELAAFEGTVIVVSSSKKVKLPEWGEVFHEKLRFGKPDARARAVYWRRALNSSIPLAKDVDPEGLAVAYELDFGKIQAVVHKACLLKAGDDPQGELDAGTIRRAVESVCHRGVHGEPLFG